MSDRPQGGGGKRRNTNAQQRREEAEAEDDEVVEAGTFQRASQEKLRKRRIVSVSGRFKSRSTPQMQAPPPVVARSYGAWPEQGSSRWRARGRRQGRGHLRQRQADGAAAGAGRSLRIELSQTGRWEPAASFISAPAPRRQPSSALVAARPSSRRRRDLAPMTGAPVLKGVRTRWRPATPSSSGLEGKLRTSPRRPGRRACATTWPTWRVEAARPSPRRHRHHQNPSPSRPAPAPASKPFVSARQLNQAPPKPAFSRRAS